MSRSRKNRKKLAYGALEERRVLTSVFFLDPATATLQIRAGDTNVEGAQFQNDMSFSIDAQTNELVVTEANAPEMRFDAAQVNRISYRGTFGDDLFVNNTNISARVVGFAGNDVITSGGGHDVVIAANGDDTVYPGDGNDYVAGGQGDDLILEGSSTTGEDKFFGGPGADTLDGGIGNDFLAGHEGNDIIYGGHNDDFVFGHDGIDQLFGGAGQDFLYGGDGNDTISGDLGNDRILGQGDSDQLSGGEGDDVLLGGDGHDTIEGDAGNDRLVGNFGNDSLRGGVGADSIIAAAAVSNGSTFGIDTVDTGADTEVDFVIAHPTDAVTSGTEDRLLDTEVIRRNLQTRFLTQNLNNPGWQQTSSGLQYRHVTVGTGATPVSNDVVEVNYSGTFIDGTQFDANDEISFGLNQVIAGWTEGLQLMQVGGTIELAIPSDLAYGPNGRGGIPGGSTLLFEVDLLDILIS
jgi:hypothetical protein